MSGTAIGFIKNETGKQYSDIDSDMQGIKQPKRNYLLDNKPFGITGAQQWVYYKPIADVAPPKERERERNSLDISPIYTGPTNYSLFTP